MSPRIVFLIALVALVVGAVVGRMTGTETAPPPMPAPEPAGEVSHPAAAGDAAAGKTPEPPAPPEGEPSVFPIRHIDRIVREPPPPPDPIPDLYVGSVIHTTNGDLKIVGTGEEYRLVRHGRWVTLFPSGGKSREEEYVEGVREGSAVQWHENGAVKVRGSHAGGRRHGIWQEFDGKGGRVLETDYEAGKIVSVRRWGEDGNLLTDADLEARATCGGRYRHLLHRFHVPDDLKKYGLFKDFGFYRETDYQDVRAIPAAWWVYVHPYWYVWAEKGE